VGAALNVHEGPQRISPHYENAQPLEIGMVVSNEPGYYEEGNFGIRIENLLVVIDKQTPFRFGAKDKRGRAIPYFGFGPLTLIPYAKNLINTDLMTEAEIRYVDAYHGTCWDKVSPHLEGEAKEWLKRNTTRFVPYKGYMGGPFPTEILGDYH
jgi:Xaa-Pro aminopeptidase